MKIVFNTDQIYLHGGIEKTMATKANYFAAMPGVKVYIVTTEQLGKLPCYRLDERIILIDLAVNYNRSISYFSKTNLKKVISHFRQQKSLFRKLRPDVIISPNFNFDHFWLPFLNTKAKVIKERHSSRYFLEMERANASFFKKLKFSFDDFIESRYDHIIVLNKDELAYIKSDNAVVIPNSIFIPHYKSFLDNKKVIAAGRISPVKAFDDLIRSWKIVNDRRPDWELHIYGDDYLGTKAQLLSLVNSLHLQEVIFFKESVADLSVEMQDCSIYAMSSITECFPMVLLEALSVGVPIVSYDCPTGPRNIITDNEDGLLTDYKDVKSLAENLLTLMDDGAKRKMMGDFAIKNVERFSNQNVMKLWRNLLNLNNV